MSSSGVSSRKLHQLIEHEGFESLVPCLRCVAQNKTCIRSGRSHRCAACNRAGGTIKCEMPTESFTDAEWRRLLRSQSSLESEEEAILEAQQEMLAKLARLRKQKKLLRKRAGDFIAREYQDIAELEELERREREELDRLERERVEADQQKDREAKAALAAAEHSGLADGENPQILAATSEDVTLTQMIASGLDSAAWSDVDFDAFLAAVPCDSSSPRGTVEPAGGSPSSS